MEKCEHEVKSAAPVRRVYLSCSRRSDEDLILRLFNPTAERLASQIELPWLPATLPVALAPFALLTLRVARDGQVVETDLLEAPLSAEVK